MADGSTDEAVLLGKEGEIVSTVAAHNDRVREDVEGSLMKRGLMTSTTQSAETATVEETAVSEETEQPSDAVAEEAEVESDGSQPE